MVQLIIDGVTMPETKKAAYSAQKVELSEDVQMISGRIVREVRGSAWEITYQYGWFDDLMRQTVLDVCEKGLKEPIAVGFLPPDADNERLTYSAFFVTDLKRPVFYWDRVDEVDGEEIARGVWGDFSVTLREVEPSDDLHAAITIDENGHLVMDKSRKITTDFYLSDDGHLMMEVISSA